VRLESRYPPSVRLSVRIYAAILHAYPRSFRAAYGGEMLRVFRDCAREARQQWGMPGIAGLWLPLLIDTTRNALAERAAEGLHMPKLSNVPWTRLGGAAAILGGLAQIAYLALATAIYFYPDWRELFLTYLYGWRIGPPLALLFVAALAALYARYTAQVTHGSGSQSPGALGWAAAGVALAGTGLVMSTMAYSSLAWGLGFSRICARVTDCNAYDPYHIGMLYGVLFILGDVLTLAGLVLFWGASRRAPMLPRWTWLLPLAGVAALLPPLIELSVFTIVGDPGGDGIIKLQVVTAGLGVIWSLCWMLIGAGLLVARRLPAPPAPQVALTT
jgi:hypothetical protein